MKKEEKKKVEPVRQERIKEKVEEKVENSVAKSEWEQDSKPK